MVTRKTQLKADKHLNQILNAVIVLSCTLVLVICLFGKVN